MRIPVFRIFFLVFIFHSVSAFASDFLLRDLGNGSAEISEYRGNAALVEVPGQVEGRRIVAIGAWAFAGKGGLRSVILPSAVRVIGDGAFSNCASLEKVYFSMGLEKIGARAFFGCPKLAGVDLEYQFSLNEVGDEAFALCSALAGGNVRVRSGVHFGREVFPRGVAFPESAPAARFPSVDVPPRGSGLATGEKYVLIIANEKYDAMSEVAYAENDGDIFRKYCRETLGVPERNITVGKNATSGQMRRFVQQFVNRGVRARRQGRSVDFIIYYAGHGLPVKDSDDSCLLPADGSATEPDTEFELGALFEKLGDSGARTVTFFIDACFSGSDRDGVGDGRLARSASSAESRTLPPNVAVFSAAALNQSAWGIPDQSHGVFTYVLLKKLKETKGEVSYEELRDALAWEVPETAQAARGATQDASARFGESFPKSRKIRE